MTQAVGVIDLQDAVLLNNAEQQKHAQRAPQAQGAPGDPEGEQRERNAERQREHDDERMREAFKLGRQHHVHEDGCQQHRQQKVPGCFLEHFYLSGEQI